MQQKRKGARWLDLGQERWSYFVGKKFVEIVSPKGTKSLVERSKLDQAVPTNGDDYALVTMPGKVAAYVRANLRETA